MKIALKIISVLMVILGVLSGIVGIAAIAAFMNSNVMGTETKALIALAAIFVLLNGVLEILGGWLGFRAASDVSKVMPAIIFGGITFVMSVISVALDPSVQTFCACIVPFLYFILSVQIYKHREIN